jgi:hypothetical protein
VQIKHALSTLPQGIERATGWYHFRCGVDALLRQRANVRVQA